MAFYLLAFLTSIASHMVNSLRRLSLFVFFLALLLYMSYISNLAIKTGSFPFADTYGFYSLLGNGMLSVLILFSVKHVYLQRFLALFAMLGLLSNLLALPAEPSPYRNPLYSLHIASALFSYAFAFFGGFSSLLRLLVEARLKHKSLSEVFLPLSMLRTGERLSLNMSFIFFTLTLVFGSFWSRSFFGKHWIDDPKLLYVLFLWLYYALLVHLNLVKRIRPKTLSYGTIAGMLFAMMNLFFVRHEL
ncbi:MAG: cytochrome c biogenesis protein [Aquificaceae bacterium]|nr:cytochrome c biogenesis protein [Aquificaceae bacterium]